MDKVPLYVSNDVQNKYTNIYENFDAVKQFFFHQNDQEGYFGLYGPPFFRNFKDKTDEERYYFSIIISISGISEVIEQQIKIPKHVLRDIKFKKCKILIACPYEGWSWDYWQTLVDNIRKKYPRLQYNDFVFLNGNLNKNPKFKSVYFNFFERQCFYEDLNGYLYSGTDRIIERKTRQHKFLYMNRRPHYFRMAAVSLLFDDRKKGLISLGINGDMYQGYYERQEHKFRELFPKIFQTYEDIDLKKYLPLKINDGIDAEKENPVIDRRADKFYNSYLHIVAETYQNYSSERSFFSEKIFKPIMYMQPFVIIGEAFALQNLKTLGYKTFDKFIDESYDSIVDDEERMYAAVKSSREFFNKSAEELDTIFVNMLPILIHNISHLQYRCQTYDVSIKAQLLEILNE